MNRIERIPDSRPPKRVEPIRPTPAKITRKLEDTLDKNQPRVDKLTTDTLELSRDYQDYIEAENNIKEAFSDEE